MKTEEPKPAEPDQKPIPDYLAENNWEKELNYKTWVTKAARFQASKRLFETHRLSSRALAYLSCYLIIASLLPVYAGDQSLPFPIQWLNFLVTSISILLLVFTQIESSSDFKLRAHQLHSNALKIADVYNSGRIAKHTTDDAERLKIVLDLTKRYEAILAECENHEPIDYEVVKTQKSEYFELEKDEKAKILSRYSRSVRWKYFALIWVPGVFTVILCAVTLLYPVIRKTANQALQTTPVTHSVSE